MKQENILRGRIFWPPSAAPFYRQDNPVPRNAKVLLSTSWLPEEPGKWVAMPSWELGSRFWGPGLLRHGIQNSGTLKATPWTSLNLTIVQNSPKCFEAGNKARLSPFSKGENKETS